MIIIGERINSTKKQVQEAIKSKNAQFILKLARDQIAAGAEYIDVNCAITTGDEVQDMDWLVSVIQSDIPDASLCIDSPNYLAIERALKVYKGKGGIFINSITAEERRMQAILPLAVQYHARLIALTMDDKGMPDTAAGRRDIAARILSKANEMGFSADDLYFDPLIRPISTEPAQAKEFLSSIPLIKSLGPVKTICGLSNISFGLPDRRIINSVFLSMAIHMGLDAAILDPLDKNIIASLKASRALVGLDEYCAEYIKAFREGRFA